MRKFKCVLCNKWKRTYENNSANNPAPLATKGECCDYCNFNKVISARIKQMEKKTK